MRLTAPDRLSFRPETEEDIPFLMKLYASSRAEELSLINWGPGEYDQFIQFQFTAQRTDYRNNRPDADYLVIEEEGAPIGRIYIDYATDPFYRFMEITLLPEKRNQGIGGQIIRRLLDLADENGKEVQVYVEQHNPAFRLYERFGFATVEIGDIYHRMIRKPQPRQTA